MGLSTDSHSTWSAPDGDGGASAPAGAWDLLTVGVVVIDPVDASARFANRPWATMSRQREGAWQGQGWWDVLEPAARTDARRDLLSTIRSGSTYHADWPVAPSQLERRILHVTATPQVVGGCVAQVVVSAVDVTGERATTDRLSHQATHDLLTGLYNRAQFLEFVSHALDQQRRTPSRIDAVLFIDVDGLKQTNDRLGHARGDQVLRAAAARIRTSVRPADVVARFGGDEFAVLCENVTDIAEARGIARRMSGPSSEATLDEPLRLSVGLALADRADLDADTLLGQADRAMYVNKERNRSARMDRPAPSATRSAPPPAPDLCEALLAVAVHELRDPLTVIAGYAATLRRDHDRLSAEEQAQAFDALDRHCANLVTLVDNLLEFDARCGAAALAPVSTPLRDILDEVWVRAPAPDDVTLTAVCSSPDLSVVAEPRVLTEALVNLLREAYRHAGSQVLVHATSGPGRASIAVEPDPPGAGRRPRWNVTPAQLLVEATGGRLVAEAGSAGGTRMVVSVPAIHG